MISFVVGVLSTVLVGVVVEVVTGGTTRILRRLRLRWSQRASIAFDPRQDDLFVITEWSPVRRLQPHRLLTSLTPKEARPEQHYVAVAELEREVLASQGSGDLVYLTGVRVDHRNHLKPKCRVTLAESDYSEVLAIEKLRLRQPATLSAADSAVVSSTREYLRARFRHRSQLTQY